MPRAQLFVLVGTHQQIELRVAELAAQRAERVDRIARGPGAKLALVHAEPRLVLDRKAQHRRPVVPRGRGRWPVARLPGGDEKHVVEPEMREGSPRHREGRVVARIEGSAEDAYGSH